MWLNRTNKALWHAPFKYVQDLENRISITITRWKCSHKMSLSVINIIDSWQVTGNERHKITCFVQHSPWFPFLLGIDPIFAFHMHILCHWQHIFGEMIRQQYFTVFWYRFLLHFSIFLHMHTHFTPLFHSLPPKS